MMILGIETSCDETAAAIVCDDRTILANIVLSQLDEHAPYGGVVPEIAARAHLDNVDNIVAQALAEADLSFTALDGIAATAGPGLIGGLMVGLMTGKAIAAVHDKAFIAVNHLEAHALTARLTDAVAFPYLLLLVSGGHCQLLSVGGLGDYRRLGGTIDDAAGEAFDKTAKLLGLGYPGGPALEIAARQGDATRFNLPRPLRGRPGCDFSFSGLKTAVRRTVEKLPEPTSEQDAGDIAASFQQAVCDVLCDRTGHAFAQHSQTYPGPATLVVAGGVAANTAVRQALGQLCRHHGATLVVPPAALCTDNAAMVAWVGVERLRHGLTSGLDAAARPRWPLDETSAPAPLA
ncbi:MAG: tRNA (adenosine(37)-N6)-threonylcarbamoyltransferase complex transferase subunit TsaD [Alphaproteobacteria bacterium]